MDTDDDSAYSKGKKRKAGPPNDEPPEDVGLEDTTGTNNVVLDVLESHREVEASITAQEGELQASRNYMRLFAKHQGIPDHEVEDFIYARELEQEQREAEADEADGVELETPASGS